MSLMSTGRHSAEKDGWWARRSKAGKLGILTLALLAFSGVAMAIFLVIAGQFSGTVTGGNWNVTLETVNVNPAETTSNCTVTQNATDPNLIDVTWTDTVAGEVCVYRAWFTLDAASSTDLQYQNIPVPAGLNVYAFDGTYCGKTVVADGTTQALIANYLEFDGTQSSITFDATNVHQFVRPSEFNSANCDPVWTP